MKGFVLLAAATLFLFGLGSFLGDASQTKPRLTVEPEPSFAEDAVSNHRHPEVDTDVLLFINHWRNSLPQEGHGGLIERDILTPGDPAKPQRKGAVLKYLRAYRRAVLQPRTNTAAFKSDEEQVFFYVTAGAGRVEAGAKKSELRDGSAVLVPAGMEYRLFNPFLEQLEMILVVEGVPAGFVPNTEISVGSYHDSVPDVGMHWAHIGRGFI
jgi:mannose-6-phosphate isomerase-like protein (cupin superfamily)